ncbi:MAG: LytTR family DNA-binding domain-containing protein [Zoogloeaceae bacterium]|jgi:two-component system response regulator AlgR|nr:LytTR family DNA-binding domain-containing protein [Zoogloeaceae bacterium]
MPLQNIAPVNLAPLSLLIVDDEELARARLRALLSDIAGTLPTHVLGEAANGFAALEEFFRPQTTSFPDLVLADIHMPGMDGLELALHLARLPTPPAVIFTTAYDMHAVQAFELNVVDYLLKPVRAQRLLTALEKVRQRRLAVPAAAEVTQNALSALRQSLRGEGRRHLSCHERGRILLVPVAEVRYFRADLKYVTARTPEREYLLDESLSQLEAEFPETFLRLHRSALIAKSAFTGLERAHEEGDAFGWALVEGVPEKLPVSRRQWSILKAMLGRH